MADKRTAPTGFGDFLEKAFPLMAEDLRAARVGLGLTSTVAAERAGLDPALYRALEEGSAARNADNLGLMMSASRCLGMKGVRFQYVDKVLHYIKVDLSTNGPPITFVDTLRLDVRELKEQSVFVSPYHALALVERTGFNETLDSRKPVDKQLIELWVAALFTLCLNGDQDYYVRLVREDPPDAEVLTINREDGNISGIRIEITQHGGHSRNLIDVVGKKLRKRYHDGTVLVVLVEQKEDIPVAELDEFIRKNNPHNQQIVIIGGSKAAGSFKVVPWDGVTKPTPGEVAWYEVSVDAKNASKGHRGYEGVIVKAPQNRSRPQHPVFVKELALHCQM